MKWLESDFNWIELSSELVEVEDIVKDGGEGNDDEWWILWWGVLEDPFKTGAEDKMRTSFGPADKELEVFLVRTFCLQIEIGKTEIRN